jgi:hypothetical protein
MRTIEIEKTDAVNGFKFSGTLSSPARVFNPVPLRATLEITSGSPLGDYLPVQVTLAANGRSATMRYSLRPPGGVIDLSGIARALFDPGEFTGLHPLLVVASMTVVAITPNGQVPLTTGGLPEPLTLAWGALPVLRESPLAWLPRWPGLPFTVPLLVEDDEETRVTLTAGGVTTDLGTFGPGKYDFPVEETATLAFLGVQGQGVYDVTFDDTFKPVPLSTRTVSVKTRSCPSRGTYLRWVDAAGDWRYYLFDNVREEGRVTDVAPSVESSYDDVAFSGFPSSYYHPGTGSHPSGKGVVTARTVGAAGLDADAYRLVSGVVRSVVVHLFDGREEGDGGQLPRWARVTVEPVTLSRGGGSTLSDVAFNVILPDGGGPSL